MPSSFSPPSSQLAAWASWLTGAAFLAAIFGSIAYQALGRAPAPAAMTASGYRRNWCVAEIAGLSSELDGLWVTHAGWRAAGRREDGTPALARWRATMAASARACRALGDGELEEGLVALEQAAAETAELLAHGGEGGERLRRWLAGRHAGSK